MKITLALLSLTAGILAYFAVSQRSQAADSSSAASAQASARPSTAGLPVKDTSIVQKAPAHLSHLKQVYTEDSGAPAGQEYTDHMGTHHWHRIARPFKVTQQKGHFGWTAEDGLRPDVIKTLANNSEQVISLENEAPYTLKRQLVYLDPAFTPQAQAMLDGKQTSITLPGLDGETFTVNINHREHDQVDPSLRVSGAFRGTIEGQGESVVEGGAFENNWSIGIRTGDGRGFEVLQRGPNEWIISQIDTAAMAAAMDPCGTDHAPNDVGAPVASTDAH